MGRKKKKKKNLQTYRHGVTAFNKEVFTHGCLKYTQRTGGAFICLSLVHGSIRMHMQMLKTKLKENKEYEILTQNCELERERERPSMEMNHSSQLQSVAKDRRLDALGDLRIIPDEILCAILVYLTPRDVARLSCVSRSQFLSFNYSILFM